MPRRSARKIGQEYAKTPSRARTNHVNADSTTSGAVLRTLGERSTVEDATADGGRPRGVRDEALPRSSSQQRVYQGGNAHGVTVATAPTGTISFLMDCDHQPGSSPTSQRSVGQVSRQSWSGRRSDEDRVNRIGVTWLWIRSCSQPVGVGAIDGLITMSTTRSSEGRRG